MASTTTNPFVPPLEMVTVPLVPALKTKSADGCENFVHRRVFSFIEGNRGLFFCSRNRDRNIGGSIFSRDVGNADFVETLPWKHSA